MLSKYENVFADKAGLLSLTKRSIEMFLKDTLPLITSNRSGDSNYWERIRYIILSYYKQKNLWTHLDANHVMRDEWTAVETHALSFNVIEILYLLEKVCDTVFYNYSLAKRTQDEAHAMHDLQKLLLYQRAYYYVYSTLL